MIHVTFKIISASTQTILHHGNVNLFSLPLIYYLLQCFTLFISILLFSRLWVHHWLDVLNFFLQASLSYSQIRSPESALLIKPFFSWNLVNVILLSSGTGMFFFVFRVCCLVSHLTNFKSHTKRIVALQYTKCHITYWRHKSSYPYIIYCEWVFILFLLMIFWSFCSKNSCQENPVVKVNKCYVVSMFSMWFMNLIQWLKTTHKLDTCYSHFTVAYFVLNTV